MRKLLLICSAISLIYGNCVFGIDSDDEKDWESTETASEQDWPVKADESMTRLERQKRDLQRLHEQFEQNNQSSKPELQELRKNSLVQERRKIFEQSDPQQEGISASENKKMTIAEYQQALKVLQEKLDESTQRENAQKAKIRELAKLLENVKQRLQQAKDGNLKKKSLQEDKNQYSIFEKQNDNSEPKGFKFKNFDIQHPENLFNIGTSTEYRKPAQSKRRINKKIQKIQPNFMLIENRAKQPQSQLLDAIKKRSLSEVSNAIKNGADINIQDERKRSPLYYAAYLGYNDIVKYLIKKHADINKPNNEEKTPLYVAAQNGHLDIVKLLVKCDADINKTTNYGFTPLHIAALNDHLNIVEYLVECGADVNKTDNKGTSLAVAAYNGHLNIVKYLIEHGADINKTSNDERVSPLYLAAQNGHLNVVKYLVEHGADINTLDATGTTPLMLAAQEGDENIVKYLVEHGADINKASTDDGVTSLYLAIIDGHANVVKFLVEHDADVNKAANDGMTPLCAAAQYGHLDIVKYLVGHGADVNKVANNGVTPLRVAAQYEHLDIVRYLVGHGAEINKSGITKGSPSYGIIPPLYVAALNGHLNIIKYLVECGANVDISTVYSSTPVSIAKTIQDLPILTDDQKKKYQEVIDYLKSKETKTKGISISHSDQKLMEIGSREENQNTVDRVATREQQPKTQNIAKQTIIQRQPQQKGAIVVSQEEHSINPLLIKYAPAMGQLEAIARAKPSTPPQDSKALLKRFAEVLEVDESMLRYEDRLGTVHIIDISSLIKASLMNSDPNAQLIQAFMNSCSKKLVSIGIDSGWLSKPGNDQSAKAFKWISLQINQGIREYKFDTSQRALAKRKLMAARPWNDNSEITEKSVTETINKANNQLQLPDPKYIRYAKALGLLEAIAGAKPSTPPPSDKSLLKRFADILGIDVNLLICSIGYYSSGICFRNMEEQIILNQATSTSADEMISTLYNNYSRELAKVGIYTIHYGTPSKEAFDVLRSQSKQGLTGYKFDMSSDAIKKRKEIALRPWDNI